MKKIILQNKVSLVAIALALATALYLSAAFVVPVIYGFELKRELVANCSNLSFPNGVARNTLLDPDNGIVYVKWSNNGNESNIRIPYEPQSGFQGCSQQAKALLFHVQEVHEKQLTDTCVDFKAIVGGAKPLPEKNGTKANLQGAIDFVNQYCK
ncbi:MAG: hypothetical protein DDT22_01111 [candidate division WS2 bacterium]|nr:hypothetical protein [Candidatus Lithacetigena glycinireducens]